MNSSVEGGGGARVGVPRDDTSVCAGQKGGIFLDFRISEFLADL